MKYDWSKIAMMRFHRKAWGKMILAGLILGIYPVALAYQNPIAVPNMGSSGVADPGVIRFNGLYYLYATNGGDTGIRVWTSSNLVNWTYAGIAAARSECDDGWAPEVLYYNDRFYMYSSGPDDDHHVMTSFSPTGPFTRVTDYLVSGIDGFPFMDDNGQLSFFYAATGGIRYMAMSSPTATTGGSTLLANCKVQLATTWTEGPAAFKHNDTYYLGYCGNDWSRNDYQVHAAKGSSIASLTAQHDNPLLIDTDTSNGWVGAGCNAIVLGPDLHTLYAPYHIRQNNGTFREYCLDKVWFDTTDGDMRTYGVTETPQPDPTPADFADNLNRSTLGSGWYNVDGGNWGMYNNELLWGDNRGTTPWSRQVTTSGTGGDYVSEFVVILGATGTTTAYPKFGVATSLFGSSGFYAWIDPVSNLIATYAVVNGVSQGWVNSAQLPSGWNHYAWHTIRVEKSGSTFKVFYDNMLKVTRTVNLGGGQVSFALEDCYAGINWASYDTTTTPDDVWADDFNRAQLGTHWSNADGGSWGMEGNRILSGDNRGSSAWGRQVASKTTLSDYRIESNLQLVNPGATGTTKYGIFSSYDLGAGNVFTAWIDPVTRKVATWAMAGSVDLGWIDSATFDPSVDLYDLHTLSIEKQGSTFKVYADEYLMVTRVVNIGAGNIGTVVEDCHAHFDYIHYESLD